MMKNRIILSFYILAIFMLANDAFFTWLGGFVGISYWRQMIWIIGILILINSIAAYPASPSIISIKRISYKYLLIFIAVVVLSVITLFVQNFNIVRIVYSWWIYFSGLPFIVFPFISKQCGWSRSRLNWLFILLGLFLSIGIFIDFLSGGLITSLFLLTVTRDVGDFEAGRYCFLSTAPTTFSIYYCLCLFCALSQFLNEKSAFKKYFLLILALLFVFASIFCGSRQTLAALLIVFMMGVFNILRKNRLSFIILLLGGLSLVLLFPTMKQYIQANSGFEERYTTSSIMEDERDETWREGLNECIINPTLKRVLIGDGVGYTAGQQAAKGEVVGDHYENTFFARISDVGWLLAFTSLLLPCFYIWRNKRLCKAKILFYAGLILAYLFICCVSPNGASGTTQMSLFIILGLFIDDAKGK